MKCAKFDFLKSRKNFSVLDTNIKEYYLQGDAYSQSFLFYSLVAMIGGFFVISLTLGGGSIIVDIVRDGNIDVKKAYLPYKIRFVLHIHLKKPTNESSFSALRMKSILWGRGR